MGSSTQLKIIRLIPSLLDKISDKKIYPWTPFFKKELEHTIDKCNNSSAPGPDKLLWRHIKMIVKNHNCSSKIIDIANACMNLGVWPSHFKTSTMVIIPKPNKSVYNSPKAFHPIILLNILDKLIEKMIGKCLQFHLLSNNFVHPC